MATESHAVQIAGRPLGRHRHICAFFNGADEEHRVLRSFIKDGFDRGEKAFHLVDPVRRDEYLKALADAGIDVQQAMATGQLEVLPWGEGYLREDRFDQNAMIALVEETLQSAAAAGYPLTRLLAHMEWALLDKPGVEDLMEYETRLNYVLRTHPVTIIGGVLQENPFFVPPDQFLLEIRERRAVRRTASMAS
jgi:MEDS: MEthanogen/methylotroph, DcmR Sensory domain